MTGVTLSIVMQARRPQTRCPPHRFPLRCHAPISCRCAGTNIKYVEAIDLLDAFHPQTILAYDMNGAHWDTLWRSASRAMRVERQLGYKMAKYIMRVEC